MITDILISTIGFILSLFSRCLQKSHNFCKSIHCFLCFRFLAVIILYLFGRESTLEQAKIEAKEALAKQVKVSLKFEIEQVGVIMLLGFLVGARISNIIII